MNAMNDYLDGLLEGPLGLINVVSRLAPILGRDNYLPSLSSVFDTPPMTQCS